MSGATAGMTPRTVARRIHLWLGLSLGLLFAVTGLTGSILVFYPEIDGMFAPSLSTVPAGPRPASWQAVLDALHRQEPERHGAWRIEVTPAGGPIPVRYYKPVESHGEAYRPLMLWLDPVSLKVVRRGLWGSYPISWIYDLHWRLLSGATGEVVMGIAGIAMLALLATGLIAWWPRGGQWRRALRWKRDAGSVRRLYDIHKLAALVALPVLLVVTATGVLLELPDQVHPLIARASPLFATPHPVTRPQSSGPQPLDRLVARAQQVFPDAALAWIETPADPTGTVRVNLARPGEPSRRFPRSNVWLDPYTGAVLAIRDGRRDSAGDTLLNWLHPLHEGEALGLAGRIAVLMSGIAVALLAFSGWLRWAIRP